ncbi:MAG: cell division protein FtsZ [Alphaproteobacteria bacterium]
MVFGVGGAGGNAVNNMIRSNLEGVECIVANTDAQALAQSLAERRIQLGLSITQGLGSGSRPEIGRAAAEEGMQEIIDHLQGCHMAFVTAGMGGGTGTGAAPVIARLAREQGVLTVAVVTKPFQFEGAHRMRVAEDGLNELQEQVDTLIVIPNQNLFRVADENTTFTDAFKLADEVLYAGVRGVTDLMTMPGLINLDFADIRTVMGEMGKAMMGAGEAEGDGRAIKAAESAIANPLLDDVSLRGARGVLINITGGNDMTLYEVDESANRIREEVDADANIIFGSTFDETIQGRIRVSIFATGINGHHASAQPQPNRVRVLDERARRPAPPAAPTEIVSDDDEPEEIFGLGPKLDDEPEIKTASQPDPVPVHEPIREPVIEPAAERTAEPVSEPMEPPAPKPIVAEATPAPEPTPKPVVTPTPIVAEARVDPVPAPAPSPAPTLVSTPAPEEAPQTAQAAPVEIPSAPEPVPAPASIFSSAPREESRKDPVFTSAPAEPAPKPAPQPVQAAPAEAAPSRVAEAAPSPTLVREVPKPETAEASDGKSKPRARSRLLGLLIDNSVSDEDRAAPAEAKSTPRVIETPAAQQAPIQADSPRAMEAAQPAPLSAGSGLDREEKEEAELLEIPAFLRRQAN